MADDVGDVKAEMLRFFEALTSGNVDGFIQHYIVGNTSFVPEGPPQQSPFSGRAMEELASLSGERPAAQFAAPAFGSGHLWMDTAVTTGYGVGTITSPAGTTQRVHWQRSAVLIKQGGQWREVHHHRSNWKIPQ